MAACGALVAVAFFAWLATRSDETTEASACTEGPSIAFCDSFDGPELDRSVWSVEDNAGEIALSDGVVALSSEARSSFPFIVTSANPFPSSGDLRLTARFRFTRVGEFGTGFKAQQGAPDNGRREDPIETPIAKVWQDKASQETASPDGTPQWVVESECGEIRQDPDTSWHTVEFVFQDSGQVRVRLDGVERDACTASRRPDTLWLGNPTAPLDDACECEWTSVEFDFVRIDIES